MLKAAKSGERWALRVVSASVLLVSCFLLEFASAQLRADPTLALQERLTILAATHHGRVALYARNLSTGTIVTLEPDTPVQTASDIKLLILLEAMVQIRAGAARWEDRITVAPGEPVGGSGILTLLSAPLTLTLRDVLTLMVVMSDNTATNLAIDRLGLDAINRRAQILGLTQTHLYKKIGKPATASMPEDQPRFGLGKSTPREMAAIMERIGRCELHGTASPPAVMPDTRDAEICTVALGMLKDQFYRNTIPRLLEEPSRVINGPAVASKTGSLDAVRNDVALVGGRSAVLLLAIFTYGNADRQWTTENEGERTIARLADEIVRTWSPQGLDGSRLVPGLTLQNGGETSRGGQSASK